MSTENNGKWRWLSPAIVLIPMMAMMGFSINASTSASVEAQEAKTHASKVAAALTVHATKQNGSFESIDIQLGTLRDNRLKAQKEFEKQLALRFDIVEERIARVITMFDTSWKHAGQDREAHEKLDADLQRLRDLVIAGGVRALPDSTE